MKRKKMHVAKNINIFGMHWLLTLLLTREKNTLILTDKEESSVNNLNLKMLLF